MRPKFDSKKDDEKKWFEPEGTDERKRNQSIKLVAVKCARPKEKL